MSHGHIARRRGASRRSRGKRPLPGAARQLPALALIGMALPAPMTPSGATLAQAASTTLCSGWQDCSSHGYSSHGYANRGYASYWQMSAGDECTNYVAYVESAVFRAPAPDYLLGNAGQWAANAAAHGVAVNHVPSVGAVAEWNGGTFGMGPLGHVAVVERVGPRDRFIDISQQHLPYDVDGYDWTQINAGFPATQWEEWPSNFIHFPIRGHAATGYYDPRTGSFALRYELSTGPANFAFRLGGADMVPLTGNWTGRSPGAGYYDRRTGIFRLRDLLGPGRPVTAFRFGPPGMIPLAGNWTGHGGDRVGYYDPRTGIFRLRDQLSAGSATYSFAFGPPGMIPLAGDWNGRGRDGIGYYNPRTGRFYLRNELSAGRPDYEFAFGPPGMVPVAGSWGGGTAAGIGYYNPRNGWFHLRVGLTSGRAGYVFRLGPGGMIPLAGQWLS
jgi:surface antigen